MRVITTYLLVVIISSFCIGQVDHTRKHWAFGKNALLSFDENGITDVKIGSLNAYTGSACYSNKAGELILSTNGKLIVGPNNQLLSALSNNSNATYDALILPKNDEETQFYVFLITEGIGLRIVDVDLDNLFVSVRPFWRHTSNYGFKLTAVKHCFSNAYWLIMPDNENKFYSYLVKPNSISEPVVSTVSSTNRGSVGDFVSNHNGTMLALSSYSDDWAEVYDFDKKCGTISNARKLGKVWGTENRPHGLSFSPDDKSLYVAWSYQQSNLYQYDLENWGGITNAVQSQENINDVLLGIDGHLYMNVHENGIPSRRIHVIRNPNNGGGGGTSRAIEDIATLPLGTNGAFEFPTFISSNTGGHCGEVGDFKSNSFLDNRNRCTNKQVYFSATIVEGTYDSIRWDFDDPGSILNSSTELRVKKDFKKARLYNVMCFAFHCSFIDTFYLPIEMVHAPSFSLGNDSTVCFGTSAEVTIPQPFDTFFWQDGHTTASRLEESGTFIADIRLNGCVVEDTITISQYPDIWTELNEEYYICDLESEATRLDAGKGFTQYKWTPTGDTTQWIIVEELGEYIVVVDAFNGCQGDGSTYVKRRCDLEYHIPNAFTPNGDELNATFKAVGKTIESQIVTIYNRWGEKIYEGPEWNGNNAIQGLYTYTIEILGYQQKIAIRRQEKGTVTLLK